ncbi:hypothetical protein OSTOST_16146, partial [Ostertagia ostertagi]
MATQLSSHKRRLTNHCNKLETAISRFKSEKLESWPEDIRTPGYEKEYGKRIKEALGAIEACSSKVEQLWEEYACALDRIENVPKVETDDYDAYANKAEGTLNLALDYTVILRGRLRACTTADQDRFSPPRVDEMKASGVDQRVLLEQLQAIVSQLRGKGEQVDNQWLMKQVLTKFPERYQRRVLERKYSMEESFQMDTLLLCLDQVISTEEKIALHTSKTGGYAPESTKKDRVPK